MSDKKRISEMADSGSNQRFLEEGNRYRKEAETTLVTKQEQEKRTKEEQKEERGDGLFERAECSRARAD